MSSPKPANVAEGNVGAHATTAELTTETSRTDVENTASTRSTDSKTESAESLRPITSLVSRYGKCKWFNATKGWGFITPHDGEADVFVHQRVIQMDGFRSLAQEEEVEFESHRTERGHEATRVSGLQGADCRGYRASSRRRIRCYNCDQYANHYANSCPLGPQPKRCHRCKEDTHLMSDCPKKNTQANKIIDEYNADFNTEENTEEKAEENSEEKLQPESADTSASWSILSAPSEEGVQPAT